MLGDSVVVVRSPSPTPGQILIFRIAGHKNSINVKRLTSTTGAHCGGVCGVG
jgi:SOS-response transcriptional repressor LexA